MSDAEKYNSDSDSDFEVSSESDSDFSDSELSEDELEDILDQAKHWGYLYRTPNKNI